jgi:transcriptional regulator with XRE-family HTH domain
MKERNVPGVGSKLKELRVILDKNQKEFAAILGVRQSTLSSYENDVSIPSIDVLYDIATKFGVSLDWMFGLSDSRTREISSLGDVFRMFFEMDELDGLRYEVECDDLALAEQEDTAPAACIKFYRDLPFHDLNKLFFDTMQEYEHIRQEFNDCYMSLESYEGWEKEAIKKGEVYLIDKKEKINLNAAERAKVRKQILISQLRYRDVRQMIAIAEKAREQVEKEYPDIDISEKNRLIDERFTKLAHEYEDMMLPGLIRETEEERNIRNERFASRKRYYNDEDSDDDPKL